MGEGCETCETPCEAALTDRKRPTQRRNMKRLVEIGERDGLRLPDQISAALAVLTGGRCAPTQMPR